MRVALDTNILVYAAGINDSARQTGALSLVAALSAEAIVIPIQALGELFHVLTRKGRWPAQRARETIIAWVDSVDTARTTTEVLVAATQLSITHQLSVWDSVILAAARSADCRFIVSEDLHDGFTWQGLTVVNPFADKRPPLFDALVGTKASFLPTVQG